MNIDSLNNFFNIVGIFGLILSFIGGLGSYFTNEQIKVSDKISKHEKDLKISELEEEVLKNKRVVKSFEVISSLTFSIPWENSTFDNLSIHSYKTSSFVQLKNFNRTNTIILEQVGLPDIKRLDKEKFVFSTNHVLPAKGLMGEDLCKLKFLTQIYFSIPVVYFTADRKIVDITSVNFQINLNGVTSQKISIDIPVNATIYPFEGFTNSGYAQVYIPLDQSRGVLKLFEDKLDVLCP